VVVVAVVVVVVVVVDKECTESKLPPPRKGWACSAISEVMQAARLQR
jgi:hypothetical protein